MAISKKNTNRFYILFTDNESVKTSRVLRFTNIDNKVVTIKNLGAIDTNRFRRFLFNTKKQKMALDMYPFCRFRLANINLRSETGKLRAPLNEPT